MRGARLGVGVLGLEVGERVRGRPCRAATRSRRRRCRRGGCARAAAGRRRGVRSGRRRGVESAMRGRTVRDGRCRSTRRSAPSGASTGGGADGAERRGRRPGRSAPARGRSRRSRSAPSPGPRPSPRPSPGPCSACTTSMPGCPGRARGRRRGGLGRPARRSGSSVLVVGEQVLLDPVGQPGDADAEQPHAAGGVELGRAGSGPAGRRRAASSVGAGSVVDRVCVVKSCSRILTRHRAARQPCLAQPLGDLAGLPVEQPLQQPPVDEVGARRCPRR